MLVSWKWLSRYLDLKMDPAHLAESLSLSGLNHESTSHVADDVVIDLEVTSNRGDCLGHLGVAREIAVLYGLKMSIPDPAPKGTGGDIAAIAKVRNLFPEACPRYTARIIRGCRVQPSPAWMQQSLTAVDLQPVNNVVDITNYVLMECGQPLHAFDFSGVQEQTIEVRPGRKNEVLEAIDHRSYTLDESMCVIADANRALAIAGVMGGSATEVGEKTNDLLIESALFTPLSVRKTARKLKLHSPSSFRFERRVDPAGVDWASRRACEMILDLAGGELVDGVIDTHPLVDSNTAPIIFPLSEIERILGITVPIDEVMRILTALGCRVDGPDRSVQVWPPTWRHDLTRPADLVEEVARIHGYDKIPEDAPIAVAASAKRDFDHAVDKVRQVMMAAGISEAMTPSIVTETLDQMVSPWTDLESLTTQTPLLKGANRLRRSLVPSLVQCRRENWAASSTEANLYEIAHTYLPSSKPGALPAEQYTLGLVAGTDFFAVKGLLRQLLDVLGVSAAMDVAPVEIDGCESDQAVSLKVGSLHLGYLAALSNKLIERLKLPGGTTFAELSLPALFSLAELVPQYRQINQFPTVSRDLNLIVDEAVRWADLETSTRRAVGVELANVDYRETYRSPEKDGADTKRILFRVELQRTDGTLTGEEADLLIQAIVNRCQNDHGAKHLA
jgi:phenylalanyl-tRNA synthetase beta chain